MDRSHYIMVAALDLGNTDSGYAWSFKGDFERDPLNIHCNQVWSAGTHRLLSLKTPTCILLDKHKQLKAFGYDAETTFSDICLDDLQHDYYFFRGFDTNKNITRDMMLVDETGKSLLASHVLQMFIKAFVNHLIKNMNGVDVPKDDIRWVIPVSANLSNTGKQLLRSCAEQAGIPSDQLTFVTETEAAFMYCQYSQGYEHNEYMVVQLEGSFTDITVLKKDDNQVIEKYRATDNKCGFSLVKETFIVFLDRIFGSQFMTSLRKEEPSSLLDIEREFEIIKGTLNGNLSRKINISIPYDTLNIFCQKFHAKELHEVIRSSIYGNDVILAGHFMRINSDLVRNFFKATIDNIVNLMESVYADYKDSHKVTAIAMFGDYSNCSLLEEAARQTFPEKDIIVTRNEGLEVMIGSVLCGHRPCHYQQISPPEMKAAQSSVTKCIFCNNPGIYHCTECTSAFCQECRTKHDKLPTTKNHTVTDLKKIDPSAFSTNAMCVLHKSEFIYFCTRCHILICGKCVTTEHKGHDITDIKTIANDYRRRTEGNISDLKVEVTMLSTVIAHMQKIEKPTIKRTSETAVAEIGETVDKITKAVSFTKEKKLDDVHSQLDMEMEEFQYDLKSKERIYEHQKNICESLERLMHVSHDITFITSYETLKRDIYDINDYVGEKEQKQVYKFDKKGFVQEVVNAIVSGFEMRKRKTSRNKTIRQWTRLVRKRPLEIGKYKEVLLHIA